MTHTKTTRSSGLWALSICPVLVGISLVGTFLLGFDEDVSRGITVVREYTPLTQAVDVYPDLKRIRMIQSPELLRASAAVQIYGAKIEEKR